MKRIQRVQDNPGDVETTLEPDSTFRVNEMAIRTNITKPTDAATTGNQFSAAGDEWHFDLDTKIAGFTKGIWKATAHLSDGTAHTVWVELK